MDDCRKYPGREVDTVDVREPNWIVRRHCTAGPLPQPPPSPGARDAVLNGCRSCLCLALSFFNSTYLYHGCCLKTNNIRHNFQPGKNMYSCDRLWESRRIHRKWGEIFSLGPKRFLHFTWFSQKLLDILTYRHNVFWHPVDILNNFCFDN